LRPSRGIAGDPSSATGEVVNMLELVARFQGKIDLDVIGNGKRYLG
jgi:hypothetical protein